MLDQGKLMLKELEEKLDRGKHVLKEVDEKLDRGKLRIEELEAESERQKRKWDTRFDLIRRIPRNRLKGTGPTPAGSLYRVEKLTSGLVVSSN